MKHRARQVPHGFHSQPIRRYVEDEDEGEIMSKRLRQTLRFRRSERHKSSVSAEPLQLSCLSVCLGLLLIWAVLNRKLIFKCLCRSITLRIQALPEYESLDGRLWRGSTAQYQTFGDSDMTSTIELVVSHCNLPLHWISKWTESMKSISNITIISKCGEPLVGAPPTANVVRLPNVGRCDHGYAHYIAENYDRFLQPEDSNKDAYVVFLKDSDNSNRNHYTRHRSLTEMIQISKRMGFACHEEPSWVWAQQSILKFQPICKISSYHNWTVLQDYTLNTYTRLRRDDNSAFASQSGSTLGEYATTVGIKPPVMPIVPVCYGGNFMAQRQQLASQPKVLWQQIEKSLSRANNIAEGHFVERLWGTMLARPLDATMMEAILRQHSKSCKADKNYVGILTK